MSSQLCTFHKLPLKMKYSIQYLYLVCSDIVHFCFLLLNIHDNKLLLFQFSLMKVLLKHFWKEDSSELIISRYTTIIGLFGQTGSSAGSEPVPILEPVLCSSTVLDTQRIFSQPAKLVSRVVKHCASVERRSAYIRSWGQGYHVHRPSYDCDPGELLMSIFR